MRLVVRKLVARAICGLWGILQVRAVEYSRESYNRLFPRGEVETPIGKVKMGEHQFERIGAKDNGKRKVLLGAIHQTQIKCASSFYYKAEGGGAFTGTAEKSDVAQPPKVIPHPTKNASEKSLHPRLVVRKSVADEVCRQKEGGVFDSRTDIAREEDGQLLITEEISDSSSRAADLSALPPDRANIARVLKKSSATRQPRLVVRKACRQSKRVASPKLTAKTAATHGHSIPRGKRNASDKSFAPRLVVRKGATRQVLRQEYRWAGCGGYAKRRAPTNTEEGGAFTP